MKSFIFRLCSWARQNYLMGGKRGHTVNLPGQSHETDDLRSLYEESKRLHPDVYLDWYGIEAVGRIESPEQLKHIHMRVREFLTSRCEWDWNSALTEGFADFRRLIGRDIFQG